MAANGFAASGFDPGAGVVVEVPAGVSPVAGALVPGAWVVLGVSTDVPVSADVVAAGVVVGAGVGVAASKLANGLTAGAGTEPE